MGQVGLERKEWREGFPSRGSNMRITIEGAKGWCGSVEPDQTLGDLVSSPSSALS